MKILNNNIEIMSLLLNNEIDKKIILNDLEQELYDALMD